MLVEDLIDLEVRMTIRTRTFPITPTARTRLGKAADDTGLTLLVPSRYVLLIYELFRFTLLQFCTLCTFLFANAVSMCLFEFCM